MIELLSAHVIRRSAWQDILLSPFSFFFVQIYIYIYVYIFWCICVFVIPVLRQFLGINLYRIYVRKPRSKHEDFTSPYDARGWENFVFLPPTLVYTYQIWVLYIFQNHCFARGLYRWRRGNMLSAKRYKVPEKEKKRKKIEKRSGYPPKRQPSHQEAKHSPDQQGNRNSSDDSKEGRNHEKTRSTTQNEQQ